MSTIQAAIESAPLTAQQQQAAGSAKSSNDPTDRYSSPFAISTTPLLSDTLMSARLMPALVQLLGSTYNGMVKSDSRKAGEEYQMGRGSSRQETPLIMTESGLTLLDLWPINVWQQQFMTILDHARSHCSSFVQARVIADGLR